MTQSRIAFHVPGWPKAEFPNGIVTYVEAIRQALSLHEVESLVLTSNLRGPAGPGLVRLHPRNTLVTRVAARLTGRNDLSLARELRRQLANLRHVGVRVIEMEETWGIIDNVRVNGVARVVRLHGPWFLNGRAIGVPDGPAFRKRVRLEGKAIANADGITAPSESVLAEVRREYGIPLERAKVVPNPGSEPPADALWSPASAQAGEVLFVGRFDRHKGGDLVLEAFARVAATYPTARLTFVGPDRGFREDGGRRWSLSEFIEERLPRSVQPRVRILGHTSPERILQLRKECAVCIVPSRYETFSMTAVEGMAQGCPMVVAQAGALPELIGHERSGLLFESGNADDLGAQIGRILASPELGARLAQTARREFQQKFSPEVVGRAMLDYYDELSSQAGR